MSACVCVHVNVWAHVCKHVCACVFEEKPDTTKDNISQKTLSKNQYFSCSNLYFPIHSIKMQL